MIEWSKEALALFKGYHKENKEFVDGFAAFPSNHLSLVRKMALWIFITES
jgi:hypothetical protein